MIVRDWNLISQPFICIFIDTSSTWPKLIWIISIYSSVAWLIVILRAREQWDKVNVFVFIQALIVHLEQSKHFEQVLSIDVQIVE